MRRGKEDLLLAAVGRRIAELRVARGHTQETFAGKLGVAAKYYQRIERGVENLTLRTLARLASTLDVPITSLFQPPRSLDARVGRPPRGAARAPAPGPVKVVSAEERAPGLVPLVSVTAAGGSAGRIDLAEIAGWEQLPPKRRARPGMFVARVVGSSMEPLIPSGSYCLFEGPAVATARPDVLLVEHRDTSDTDTGTRYAVKRVELAREGRRRLLRLSSLAPDLAPQIVPLQSGREAPVRMVARFLEVLGRDG